MSKGLPEGNSGLGHGRCVAAARTSVLGHKHAVIRGPERLSSPRAVSLWGDLTSAILFPHW